MGLKLEIQSDAQDVRLETETVDAQHISDVIQGVFGLFGVPMVTTIRTSMPQPKLTVSAPSTPVQKPATPQVATTSRSKTLPLQSATPDTQKVYSTDDATEPTAMQAAFSKTKLDSTEEPIHYKTGYKINEHGERRYKCYYRCPSCQMASSHYIHKDREKINCYNCHEEMDVRKAVPSSNALQPDQYLNWFIAGNQLSQEEYEAKRNNY